MRKKKRWTQSYRRDSASSPNREIKAGTGTGEQKKRKMGEEKRRWAAPRQKGDGKQWAVTQKRDGNTRTAFCTAYRRKLKNLRPEWGQKIARGKRPPRRRLAGDCHERDEE